MTEFIKQNKLLSIFLLADLFVVLLSFAFQDPVITDSMEHLRASYLVSLGDVPYRDFFEHHHPLLWYAFAPIAAVLPHNALLSLYVARFCAFLSSCAMLYVLYLIIKNFVGGAKLFPYFVVLLFLAYPCVYSFSSFKPDAFARLFYFIGLYCFFLYIKEQKTRFLCLCFLTFFIAFCFLQTFAFDILPLIIPALILFYNKPVFYRDVGVALILPAIFFVIAIYLMIANDVWKPYFEMNWLFNKEHRPIIYADTVSTIWDWMWLFVFALIALIFQLKNQSNVYFKILGWLFVCEIVQHIIVLAIYPHYLVMLFIFSAFICAPLLYRFWHHLLTKFVKTLIIALFILDFAVIASFNQVQYMQIFNKVNSSPDNQIVNFVFCWLNIYAPKINFYTVMPHRLAAVDNYLYNRFPDYDVNKFIQENKIKYIDYSENNLTFFPPTLQERFMISEETLREYEEIDENIYQRKDTLEPVSENNQ